MMKNILLLISLFVGIFSARGNNIPYPFSQYNYTYLNEDVGLPHNFVDDIFKDSQGYIWIATHNGLARYDGYKYVTFTTLSKPISLKNNYVHKVCEDNFNRLWIASEEGIDIVDLNQYRNVNIPTGNSYELERMMNSDIVSIYKDRKGDMWISSENTLYCVELDNEGNIANYYCLEDGSSTMPVRAVIDLGWAVCAGINNSIERIDKRKGHMLKTEPVSKLVNAFSEDWAIHCMELDGEILWIGTNRGLFKYDHFNREIKRYRHSFTKPGMLSQSYITDVKLDKTGTLFVSTLKGLNVYDRKKDEFSYIQQNDDHNSPMLNCNFINCLLQDDNCIWVGTEIGGVNLLTRGRLVTHSWTYSPTNKSSLSPNPVNAICEDNEENLWVGTVEGGLNLLRKGASSFEHFVSDPKDSTTISHNSVSGILLDRDNHLWIYTWGGGISELDLNIRNNTRFKQYRNKVDGVELNFISSACLDTINNGIWFGTTEGLHFFDKQKKEFIKVKFSLPNNRFDTMAALLIDKKNRLWVGTSKGLFIIDIFSFARSRIHFDYTYIKNKLSDTNTSTADKINCIFQDKDGVIWLGANGSGLYRLVGDEGGRYRFKNYTIEDGLPNNNIIGIVEDRNRSLWFSTNNGISQLDKQRVTFSNYTKYDGLLTNQFYWNAYLYSPVKNLIYFGNTKGLVAIQPNVPNEKHSAIKVSLTGLSILGNTVYPTAGDYLEEYISSAKRINLHESDRVVTLDFSAKRYDYTNQIRYAYRLKGYNEKWTDTKIGEHSATYTSLPPGTYVFQVRATNNSGYWSDEITGVEIHVAPYFYKSWWFISLVVLLLAAGSCSFYIWKTNKYRQQKEELESTVQERTGELAEQNRRLIEVSRKLANTTEEKISFFTYIVHEFRTPVTLINGPLEKALQQSDDPTVKEHLRMAERNSKYLLTLVNELMDFRKLDSSIVRIDKKCENIQTFIEYILMPFHAFAREQHIELKTFYRLRTSYLVLDYNYIRKVIINLVSNAIKLTPGKGVISVYIASLVSAGGEELLYINVCDTGMGIPEEDLERIFDQFYQSKNKAKNIELWQSSTGVGLFSCKKIIELHDGTIKACNNKNKGASFRILLPHIEGEYVEEYADYKISEIMIESENTVSSNASHKDTILIVDDNTDMRSYINSLLAADYNILEAQDGAEALVIIRSQNVDLILSDLMMPVMDGIELSQQVKADLSISHIPFLILTALVSEEQKKISYKIGVDEYLCKPFDEEILLLRIHNILNLRKKHKTRFSASMNSEDLNITIESKDEKFIQKALMYMKENYNNPEYELDSFVRDMGYSKTLVNRKLQNLSGQSIGQFMRNYRLNVAREILANISNRADINISEIAYNVGFNDPKYFTRCFKEYTGVLPSALLPHK